jgi:hypothetical protein
MFKIKRRLAALLAGAAVVGAAGVVIQNAAATSVASSLVPIAPCRLLDTRSGSPVGEHPGPLAPGETATLTVSGAHGNCAIPAGTTGVAANVTIANPTSASYLTLFPADAPAPTASNLNWVAGQQPTPNHVTVGLSAAGAVSLFNFAGNVDVLIDIVGYYQAGGAGGSGLPGPGLPSFAYNVGSGGLLDSTHTHLAVATATVPAGTYLLAADISVAMPPDSMGGVYCKIVDATSQQDLTDVAGAAVTGNVPTAPATAVVYANLHLGGVMKFASTTGVQVRCELSLIAAANVHTSTLSLVALGTQL